MARFTLYINFQEKMVERPLPAENNRKLFMDFSDIIPGCIVSFEVFDNAWTVFSGDNYSLRIMEEKIESCILSDGNIIKVDTSDGSRFVMMVYEINENITSFSKFSIKDKSIIKIGKKTECDISIDSSYISSDHAVIEKNGNNWLYKDTSLNGSYINGIRVSRQQELKIMDVISAVGIKFVYLGDCIAINRKDIVICKLDSDVLITGISEHNSDDSKFSRSPRTVEPLFDDVIEIEAPPAPQRQRNQPLIFVIGPSVTMPLPILFSTFINSQLNSSSRSYLGIIASVGMSALIGAGWAIAHYQYNKKVLKEDEQLRLSAYKEYIKKNELLIRDKQNYDNSVLISQYLSSNDIVEKLIKEDNFIWNRNVNQEDFLSIRLGTGNVDFGSHIAIPKQRFSLYNDSMAELPHKVFEKYRYIKDAVVTIDLRHSGIIGILGLREQINRTAVN